MAYIKINSEGRITAASRTHHCGKGEIEIDIPEEIGIEVIHEYRYVDGEFLHAPLPDSSGETGPTQEERIAALEQENAYLKETLEIILSGATEEEEDGEPMEAEGV